MEQHQVGLSAWLMISTVGVSALFMGHQLLEEQKCYVILFLLFFLEPWTQTAIVLTPTMELRS